MLNNIPRVSRCVAMMTTLAIVSCFVSCSGQPGDEDAANNEIREVVFVTNYALEYLTRRIVGDDLELIAPFPNGEDPAFWDPSTDVLADMQRARLIVMNGAGYERWANKVSLPDSRTVDSSFSFKDDYIYVLEGPSHRHGPDGESHQHAGLAVGTWLDPNRAITQAQAIEKALAKSWPDKASDFESRLRKLETDLKELDSELRSPALSPGEQPIVTSHPVYEYLASEYEWYVKTVHWEPKLEPSEEEWQKLDELLQEHEAKIMIWEAEPVESTRQKLQQRGIEVVVFEICANRPAAAGDDYMSVMKRNLENLRSALQ